MSVYLYCTIEFKDMQKSRVGWLFTEDVMPPVYRINSSSCSVFLWMSFFVTPLSSCGKIKAENERHSQRHNESSVQEVWNGFNKPSRMDRTTFDPVFWGDDGYVLNFSKLPMSAQLPIPWSDAYWASQTSGIAFRWNSADAQNFSYKSPSKEEVGRMSREQLAALSPAEKYDIYMGRFDYPTVKEEWARTSPQSDYWEGLCDGVASASIKFPQEPNGVDLRSASGITVPFGSSDVKALLARTQYLFSPSSSIHTVGAKCGAGYPANHPACVDTNAGTFHIALANELGLRRSLFLADVDNSSEVWNHQVYAFEATLKGTQNPSAGAAPGTVKEAVIATVMHYREINPNPKWGKQDINTAKKKYEYRIELDQQGNIVGGAWISEERPDFLWVQDKATFTNYSAGIMQVYNASLGEPSYTIIAGLWCPPEYTAFYAPDFQGTFCGTNEKVLGPFPRAMVSKCRALNLPEQCESSPWKMASVNATWGVGRCPIGTSPNTQLGYCADEKDVYGPFNPTLVKKCEDFGGGPACRTMRWSKVFIQTLL